MYICIYMYMYIYVYVYIYIYISLKDIEVFLIGRCSALFENSPKSTQNKGTTLITIRTPFCKFWMPTLQRYKDFSG